MNSPDPLLDPAVRLMQFLARTQELKEKPVRDINSYIKDGAVRWFFDIPEHPAINLQERLEPGAAFLTVKRIPEAPVPLIPENIEPRVTRPFNDPSVTPKLQASVSEDESAAVSMDAGPEDADTTSKTDSDESSIQQRFEEWLGQWTQWAAKERKDKSARQFYTRLFQLRREAEKQSEELELVLGIGLLTWTPKDHDAVQRHLYTAPMRIELDADSGSLSVQINDDVVTLNTELDMLDPAAFGSKHLPGAIRERVEELIPLEINAESIAEIAKPTAHDLSAEGRYLKNLTVPEQGPDPVISSSPALILRPRPRSGLSKIFRKIAEQIEETGRIPDGIKPLLDPDLEPSTQPESKPGAVVKIGEEIFSPLPLNEVQKRILDRVDNNAQTLVQGPPGTGKTHTAAALLTHLLAQGKRVLVTAKTDRALYEVRGKLPNPIKSLAVSVIGTSRDDMAELTSAVDTISRTADDFSPEDNQRGIETELEKIHELKMQRQRLINELVESYTVDASPQEYAGYVGTSAELVREFLDDSQRYSWIRDFSGITDASSAGYSSDEALEWLGLQRDEKLTADAEIATGDDPVSLNLPDPDALREYLVLAQETRAEMGTTPSQEVLELLESLGGIPDGEREMLGSRINSMYRSAQRVSSSPQKWVADAFNKMQFGALQLWVERAQRLDGTIRQLRTAVEQIGPSRTFEVQGDPDSYRSQVAKVRQHIERSGALPTKPDGSIKFGLFTPAALKESRAFLEGVKVDGIAPSTLEDVEAFDQYTFVNRTLQDFESRWSFAGATPSEARPEVRISELQMVLDLLQPAIDVARELSSVNEKLIGYNAPPVEWNSETPVREYREALEFKTKLEHYERVQKPVKRVAELLDTLFRRGNETQWLQEMRTAVQATNPAAYTDAHAEAMRLSDSSQRLQHKEELRRELMRVDPDLVETIELNLDDPIWDERLATLKKAANWLSLGWYLGKTSSIDPNEVQSKINAIEDQIRKVSGELAALRAWGNAVSPERLSRSSRSSLTHYVQQVRKLGKGTGKYAAKQRATVQRALDDCRSAVPVWIMPISSIVDQLDVEENLFDVVLVDEASQAGMEAAFLQYLAPKMVVIGDDKQVSPSAVGIDQQQIQDLAQQYLQDVKFSDTWKNPTKSLFDDANLRFGGKLTLVEHRRCVPEIINFSNRIAYEPEKIQLIPVRQVGADRLAPFKIVHTKHGYQQGTSAGRMNPVEADAVVRQIKDCLANPEYDGLTFGVISLLGGKQAKLIEGKLLQEIDALDWEKRQLMVGISSDFQGAERDVMFLSMVAADEPGKRNAPLTRDMYIQRYNVAVSRAKEQVWIFHSVPLEGLTNQEDMRFQLLDYAYGVARQQHTMAELSPSVPHGELVAPFDSLFEQRVYNQIAAKGYTVKSQQEALGYSIDLVVSGAAGKIAVECDGDHWHGPAEYERDLARQRDLERCGWEFFRVRESEYYLDSTDAMSGLWAALEEKGIRPSDWVDEDLETTDNVIVLDGTEPEEAPLREPDSDLLAGSVSEETGAIEDHEELQSVESSNTLTSGHISTTTLPEVDLVSEDQLENSATDTLFSDGYELGGVEYEDPVSESEILNNHPTEGHTARDRRSADGESLLRPALYEEFPGDTVPARLAETGEITEGLIAVLTVEGPAKGKYLFQAYNQASGGKRTTKEITRQIKIGLNQAKIRGEIVEDNPLDAYSIEERTYRLPDQPRYRVRSLGPRSLGDVPPAELLTVMDEVATEGMSNDTILRAVLAYYERKSLTAAARGVLFPVLEMMKKARFSSN